MKNNQVVRTLYHCTYAIHYHLVIVTKYRRKCLSEPIQTRLQDIFRSTVEKWGCELMECNGESDHMHLLISALPTIEPSKLVNNIKTVSSRLIRKEFESELTPFYRKRVLWSHSYGIFACGGAPLSIIKQYIEQQGESER